MKITRKIAITISTFQLDYLKPEQLQDPAIVGSKLSFHGTTKDTDAEIEEDLARWNKDAIYLGHIDVDFDIEITEDGLRAGAVKSLRRQAADIRAEASAKAMLLDDRADKLLAIENGMVS